MGRKVELSDAEYQLILDTRNEAEITKIVGALKPVVEKFAVSRLTNERFAPVDVCTFIAENWEDIRVARILALDRQSDQ